MRNALLCILLCAACRTEGVTITGTLRGQLGGSPPATLGLMFWYSGEDSHQHGDATQVSSALPSSFSFDVPGAPYDTLEDKHGYSEAAGELWITEPWNHSTSFDDHYDGVMIQLTRYVLIYLTEDPGADRPFLVDGMREGWNLIRAVPLTCADKTRPLPDGTLDWSFRYERLSLDTPVELELGYDPWKIPYCP